MYSLLYKPPFSWPLCYVVSEHDGIVAFSHETNPPPGGGGYSHHPNTLTQFGSGPKAIYESLGAN